MDVANVADLHTQTGLTSFTARTNVTAKPCVDGVTVVDAAGAGVSSYTGRCYLIVNDTDDGAHEIGDRFAIVPADVFEALFTAATTEATETAAEGNKFGVGGESFFGGGDGPTRTPQVVHNDDGSITVDGVTYNPPAAGQQTGAQPAAGAQGFLATPTR